MVIDDTIGVTIATAAMSVMHSNIGDKIADSIDVLVQGTAAGTGAMTIAGTATTTQTMPACTMTNDTATATFIAVSGATDSLGLTPRVKTKLMIYQRVEQHAESRQDVASIYRARKCVINGGAPRQGWPKAGKKYAERFFQHAGSH